MRTGRRSKSISLRTVSMAALALILGVDRVSAQDAGRAPVESEYRTVLGHHSVTDGFANRTFTSSWGNYYRADGLGFHAEVHRIWREENASLFVGGLSYSTAAYSIKGVVGTSTNNDLVMPGAYARLEAAQYSPPATGLNFRQAVTYRNYRAGIDEVTLEASVEKYIPDGKDSAWIFQVFGKASYISLGDHIAPSGGGSIAYATYKKHSVGMAMEVGLASYDSIIGTASLDERFVSVRPNASVYLTNKLELFAQGELTDRQSYRIYGGQIGLKLALD